jgi:hypothetical protein
MIANRDTNPEQADMPRKHGHLHVRVCSPASGKAAESAFVVVLFVRNEAATHILGDYLASGIAWGTEPFVLGSSPVEC